MKQFDNRLDDLYIERDVLQNRLETVKLEILKLSTTCDTENSQLCEFIKKRASYVCKICRKKIVQR